MTTTDRETRARALEAAAEWLLRLRADDMSSQEVDAWTQWLLADPAHARAFDDLSLLWDAVEPAAAGPATDARPAAAPAVDAPRRRPPRAQRRAGQGRRRLLAALVAGVGVLALGGWWFSARDAGGTTVVRAETGVGEHRQVRLSDGTVVDLGAASRMEVRYSPSRREVELLAGQGLFAVAQQADRPFEVRAGDAMVRALGTRFSVSLRPQSVAVVVSEGQVQVNDLAAATSAPLRLVAGLGGTLRAGGGIEGPVEVDPADATAWVAGQIVYRGAGVADVVADLNRYSGRPVVLMAEAESLHRVTGRWLTRDVDGWLEGLAAALSLEVVREPERILLVPTDPRGG